MAPHSSTLAWKIPRAEEPGRLQSMGLLRVRHDWETSLSLFTSMYWRRQWHPTPVFLPGKSHGWRSLVGFSPWGREESDTTKRLHFYFSLSCIEEGNGNPLQFSCLENPHGQRSLVGCSPWCCRVGHTWATKHRVTICASCPAPISTGNVKRTMWYRDMQGVLLQMDTELR